MNADLEWILNTPSLINHPEGISPFSCLKDHLQQANVSIADKLLINPPKRLGIYYENLIEYLINQHLQPSVLRRNEQVIKNKKTLGEFDFIGRIDKSDFHLECAIKFYLRVGGGEQLSDYIGPGKQDRFDIKYQRMFNHQIPLSSSPEGLAVCLQHGIAPQYKLVLLQGYLFHPFSESIPHNLAKEINPSHLSGWWLRSSETPSLGADYQFGIMRKPFWLTPIVNETIGISELQTIVEAAQKPFLITRGRLLNGTWQEKDRGFIVPDAW